LLSDRLAIRGVAIATGVILVITLAARAAHEALVKSRNLAARLRWWHWLWFLVLASGLVFRVRDIEAIQEAPLDLWAAGRIGLVGLVAMVLLGRLANRTTHWDATLVRGFPAGVCLYGLISLISTLWSLYPMWTLYKSVEYLIDVALLAAVVTVVRNVDEIKSLFDWTWLLCGLLLITVWLGVLVRPDVAAVKGIGLIGVEIQGIFPWINSNGVGELAAILLVIAATRLLFRNEHRSPYWLACFVALATLVFAQSRSAITGGLLGLVVVLVFERRLQLLALVGIAGAALLLLTNAGVVLQQAFMRGQSPDLFYSLSGRVSWWVSAWDVVRENPFWGIGGYAGRFAVLGPLGVTEASSVHNAWIEILVGVGLIGFLPFVSTFLGIWSNLLRRRNTGSTPSTARELQSEAVGIFALLSFRSIFSDEFIWHPPLLFFLVLGYAELLRRGRPEGVHALQPLADAWGEIGGVPAGLNRPRGDPGPGP